jgi:predicted transcriptional regulator
LRPKKNVLTDLELEIMKVIWRRETATVREVYEELLTQRKIAYTTVMTMMGVLERKGRVVKQENIRAYIYSAAEPPADVVGSMVQDFLKRVFDGSAKPLLLHLVENEKVSREELDDIRKRVKAKRRKK